MSDKDQTPDFLNLTEVNKPTPQPERQQSEHVSAYAEFEQHRLTIEDTAQEWHLSDDGYTQNQELPSRIFDTFEAAEIEANKVDLELLQSLGAEENTSTRIAIDSYFEDGRGNDAGEVEYIYPLGRAIEAEEQQQQTGQQLDHEGNIIQQDTQDLSR